MAGGASGREHAGRTGKGELRESGLGEWNWMASMQSRVLLSGAKGFDTLGPILDSSSGQGSSARRSHFFSIPSVSRSTVAARCASDTLGEHLTSLALAGALVLTMAALLLFLFLFFFAMFVRWK